MQISTVLYQQQMVCNNLRKASSRNKFTQTINERVY